jgi:hypothetical protein
MTSSVFPSEVMVHEEANDSVRFILPLRDLKYGKWISGVLMIVGLLIFSCTVFTLYTIAASFLALPAPKRNVFGGGAFFFTIAAAPMTWGGLAPFWWGLVSFFGHREIEVRGGFLLTVERCGPFWRSKRWPVERIGSFEIKPLANWKKGESPPVDMAAEFNALLVHPIGGKQGMVAWGYPVALLAAVARELAARCNRAAEVKGFAEAQKEERVSIYVYGAGAGKPSAAASNSDEDEEDEWDQEEEWDEDTNENAPVAAPPNTTIRFERLEEREFTVTIPPAGVWKGSKGLFAFSLLWCGAMTLFTTLIAFAALNKNAKANDDMPWFAPVIFGLFWLVGIAVFLSALNMGRRRAAIALVGGNLMAIQTGIFGSKKREWALDEIKEIRVGPSGIEVNKQPVNELQIVDKKNDKFGFLAERDDDELRWLASELRARCLQS